MPFPRFLARAAAAGLALAATLVAVPREAHAEQRSWNFLTTGNGHGFQVFDANKHRVTTFLEHPYRYIAPATVPALPPESEGIGRRNLAFDVFFGVKGGGWLSGDTGTDAPEYVDQSNIIHAPATVGGTKADSYFFAPFGLERNVMIGLLHAPGASDGYALFNFHMGNGRLDPDATGEAVRAVQGIPKAIVETGPGGGAMIYVPVGGADHADCAGVFDKGNGGQDLADKADCSGNDVAVGFQKKLGADGWMGFATAYVENAADADAVAAEINTWVKARTPDKVLADAKAEFEAWRKPPPAGTALCSDDEKKLWRQGEAVLRMGQVREANTATRKNHGMILASLPIGEWHTGWVRDATYAVTALARMGHTDEARLALDFFLNAFQMNPGGKGKYRNLVNNADYRISVVRYYGTGEEEADTNQDGPNVETDGWGLVLWAARNYVEAAGAEGIAWLDKPTFSGTVWQTLTAGIATPIETNLETVGASKIMGKDSSIWEVHDAKKRHYAYTTLTAARGLCDAAGIAKKGNKPELAHYQDLAKQVREGFNASFIDPQGALAGSLEGLQPGGKYTDGAVAEAFTWNILQDWTGDTAKATLDLMGKLKVDSGGYKRNDDGLSSYDNNEWILVDLRIANALRRAGRGADADGIIAHIVQKAAANFYLVPELYNDTAAAGQTGVYTGSIPMVGYGGGAFAITMLDRSGITEANDCGDGKGATLPKVTCSSISTDPGNTGGPGGDGGAGAGPGGVPDGSQVPFVAACLCVLGPDRGISPYGLALFLAAPVLLLARRLVRRRRPWPSRHDICAMTLAIELLAIEKSFGGVHALRGAELAARPAEILGLCGENGAGKSTLLKVLSGVYPASSYAGTVRVRGEERRFMGTRDAERAGIAIVHQELMLVPELSVAANLVLGREAARGGLLGLVDDDAIEARARELLAKFGVERDIDPAAPVGHLGIGLQQVVEIVRALSQDAKILILDEPTAALTGKETDRLMEWLRGLRNAGTTCIYVSHRMDEIFTICDRITVLRDGKTVGTVEAATTSADTVVSMMVGRAVGGKGVRATPLEGEAAEAAPSLVLRDLSVRLPGVAIEASDDATSEDDRVRAFAVEKVSLSVKPGEVVAVCGAMGSGRTALLSTLFGCAERGFTGSVRIAGREVTLGSPRDAISAGIALIPEDRKGRGLVLGMTVSENLTLPPAKSRLARMLEWIGFVDEEAEELLAARRIDELHIRGAAGAEVATLSGGNPQKVVIGKWLENPPAVLLLDEPTRGVDVGAREEIYGLLAELGKKGTAILLASSDLPEVLRLAHRILVLRHGRIVAELDGRTSSEEDIVGIATGATNVKNVDAEVPAEASAKTDLSMRLEEAWQQ